MAEIAPPRTLESDQDSAAQRATVWTNLQQRGAIISSGLKVQKVPRIDDRLRANRQTERRQILGDLDAERRIVNCQTAGEGIDRKHGRFRREAKYRLHMRASGPVAGKLHGYGVEEAAVEDFCWIRDPAQREFLPAAKRITGRRGPDMVETAGINHPQTACGALLIGHARQGR